MRELRFRAWHEKLGRMFDDVCVDSNGTELLDDTGKAWWIGHEHIMQFTGLLDKNGREIYEGDVVKFTSNTDCDYDGVVEFADGCFIIITDDIGWYFSDIPVEEWGLEVSGNIYEKR